MEEWGGSAYLKENKRGSNKKGNKESKCKLWDERRGKKEFIIRYEIEIRRAVGDMRAEKG